MSVNRETKKMARTELRYTNSANRRAEHKGGDGGEGGATVRVGSVCS